MPFGCAGIVAAIRHLKESDWEELNHAFESERDPLAGGVADPAYERLFTRIVMATQAPLGVGKELHKAAA